ncbi:hypothetical protein F5Y14DRAFT_426130 [Nemania sp. NC0429]|nr:hypothetical protein F5Y14DRAFT_426130 [Nemania sp. NC0429]
MSLASPVKKDGFSFAGDLHAESSGGNSHRRAGLAELKEHFKSGSDKYHPAHWFEAQLIHYGLQPSKTKSVARMRLFDAVNSGKLAVPAHIKKLEADLKKEWNKNERQAKNAAARTAGSASRESAAASGKKRKADSSNVDMSINVGGINITLSANNASSTASAAKKAKTSTAGTPSSKAAKDTAKVKASPASKAAKDKPEPKKPNTPKQTKPANPAKKQTARRGGISQGPGRGSSSQATTATDTPPRKKQTARRSGAFMARGRIPPPGAFDPDDDPDEPPPPYHEYDDDGYDNAPSSQSLEPLGLLNGRYDISSNEVSDQWGFDDLDLVLTLSGRELWGKFDLGVVSGIMHFDERPWQSSRDPVPFTWRGEERDGPVYYGNSNRGWITFLGDGRIEGELDYMSLDFSGERVSGQSARSSVDAQSMLREWNGYSEDEYDRRNRSRWG